MITPGKYSAWFKTPVGEGAGIVDLGSDGKVSGGDDTFAYAGNWTQEDGRIRATYSAKRVAPGPPGVFGMDEIEIIVTGRADGKTITGTGFAKQSPGLKLEVVLTAIDER